MISIREFQQDIILILHQVDTSNLSVFRQLDFPYAEQCIDRFVGKTEIAKDRVLDVKLADESFPVECKR